MRQRYAWLSLDLLMWVFGLTVAASIRRLYVSGWVSLSGLTAAFAVVLVAHVVGAALLGLYAPGRVRGTHDEVIRLTSVIATAGCVLLLIDLAAPVGRFVPGTVPVVGAATALGGALALRMFVGAAHEQHHAWRTPFVVVGEGGGAGALEQVREAAEAQGTNADRVAETALQAAGVTGPSPSAENHDPILLSKAVVGPLEEEWVLKALRSGYVAPLGPIVDELERRVAQRVGVQHALAVSSGTAALHLLMLEVGAGPGKHVVLPTMTFAATANAIMYTGATPYFVDVQRSDANIDVGLMLQAVDELQATGEEVAAVVTVDLYGRCCDYTRIVPELLKRGVPLVEDAAEALGASHQGKPAGSFGVGAALSFNGNKIITTSGGGMIVSNDGDLIERARYLSTQARQPLPWYEHTEVGYNYRMSNVLAGLGVAQLGRLDEFIARRRAIKDHYANATERLDGVRLLGRGPGLSDSEDNCWLSSVILEGNHSARTADALVAAIGANNIEARHLWKPLHGMSAYRYGRSLLNGTADDLFRCGINLPSGVELTDHDIDRVIFAFEASRSRGAVV